jgi:hypothetical protein
MTSLRRGLSVLGVLAAGLAALLSLGVATASAGPLSPTQDPFYSYSGSLTGVAPGAVLRTRTVSFDAMGLTVPVTTSQVLYRTTDELGNPTVAVATVIEPLTGATHKIVSYQWAYDGMAANCEPSYAIQGGTPTESTNADEQDISVLPLLAGDTVVIPDYETEGNDFAAGREEGQATLDGIKAAEQLLDLPASSQVAIMGYSGGAIATDWAAELASTYAPTVNLVGTAIGGVAVDLNHNLTYVNGSAVWSGAIPAALVGIGRAFDLNLSTYLSSYGMSIADKVGASCLETDLGGFPGLTYEQLLKPRYTNINQIPAIVNPLNTEIMGTGGTPEEPIYMGIGDADGVGDDVMVDADDEALATKYCNDGLSVDFNLYKGDNHESAGTAFLPQAAAWVIGRLQGVPPHDGCSEIPAGDSLAPLATVAAPAAAATTTAKLQFQLRSASGRTVHVRLRAVHAAIKHVTVEVLNSANRVVASRSMTAARGKLLIVTLRARSRLQPGTYRVIARAGTRTLARRTFTVKRAGA